MVDISGLDKAAVLKTLHDNTRPLGLGRLHARNVTIEDARADIADFGKRRLSFEYYNGRPLKVDISGDSFNELFYDRDAGPGAAQRAIDSLRKNPKR